ncbi:hypothetical protein GCM10010399_33040 [Dactylosporangium fulvum]|uniref:MarR family transcriptional regulator n=1 Tax=Dactylosporangium fulvum TaxID=53359 RepID=A0ABY5W0C6_9ACTN|nr:hypothetical protein [Dactylosporangium fulvum]UWP82546.1 hypothetical protein Dfulv_47200 [Dactylosporangium fulvum]
MPLNGQIIGQAERSTRALLDRLLARTATTFEEWVAVNLTAVSGGTLARDDLVARMATGLRITPAAAGAAVTGLVEAGLLDAGGSLTPAGRARYDEIAAGVAELTARLYAGFPADDLDAAGRVLAEITARADAELATAA